MLSVIYFTYTNSLSFSWKYNMTPTFVCVWNFFPSIYQWDAKMSMTNAQCKISINEMLQTNVIIYPKKLYLSIIYLFCHSFLSVTAPSFLMTAFHEASTKSSEVWQMKLNSYLEGFSCHRRNFISLNWLWIILADNLVLKMFLLRDINIGP